MACITESIVAWLPIFAKELLSTGIAIDRTLPSTEIVGPVDAGVERWTLSIDDERHPVDRLRWERDISLTKLVELK